MRLSNFEEKSESPEKSKMFVGNFFLANMQEDDFEGCFMFFVQCDATTVMH
jgi:hypothetical protein